MENNQLPKDKVLEKARKLIAMMTSSNANEVENASKLLQKLIEKYDLDENLLYQIKENKALVEEDGLNLSSYQINGWEKVLSGVVARFYDCQAYSSRNKWKKTSKFVIVGFDPDKTIAKEFLKHLLDLIESEATYKSMHDNPHFINGKQYKNDFSTGAAFAISKRLREMKEAQKAEANHLNSKELMVLKDKQISDFMDKLNLKAGKTVDYNPSKEFMKGHEYGTQVALNTRGVLN